MQGKTLKISVNPRSSAVLSTILGSISDPCRDQKGIVPHSDDQGTELKPYLINRSHPFPHLACIHHHFPMMNSPKLFKLSTSAALLAVAIASAVPSMAEDTAEILRIDHQIRQVEGWTVHVDPSLLEGEHKETGTLALRILGERLHQIVLRLPAAPVAKMMEVPVFLDRNHPLGNAHYHPDGGWLARHGYDPAMAKAVHFTGAASLIREASIPHSTSVVLHELAHAYHDRELGFDHPGILAAYQVFCDSRKFDEVQTTGGAVRPHYGLTDHKEFFAEMTETFFVGNGYYPFNHVQLHQEHLPTYELIAGIWSSEIKPPVAGDSRSPGILDLRIMATLMSQRGDFEGAFELISKAQERDADREGRIASLREQIEGLQSASAADEP